MSEWDQRIREHHAFGEMQSLGPIIDSATAVEGIDPEAIAGLERIRAILAFCGKRLAGAEPLIATPAPLNDVAEGFIKARGEIEHFLATRDFAHITSANIEADRALIAANQIPAISSPEELGALVFAATKYRGEVEQALSASQQSTEKFRTETESLRSNLSQLTADLQAEQKKLAEVVSDFQLRFSEVQEKRGLEFTETVRLAQQELTKIITDYQGQFSTAQETRGQQFSHAQGTRQEKFNEQLAEYSTRLTEQNAEFTRQREDLLRLTEEHLAGLSAQFAAKAARILEAVEEEKKRIEKLVGVIGNLGVTSGYLNTANHARKTMWFWQGITVAALIALSALAYKTLGLLETKEGTFIWGAFAARVLLLGSLGVIAAYAGSQADKLFAVERRNRKLALELEAIGPYLAPLPEEEQNNFRIQMGERSFGRDEDIKLHSKSPASLFDLVKLKELKDLLKSKDLKDLIALIAEAFRKTKA